MVKMLAISTGLVIASVLIARRLPQFAERYRVMRNYYYKWRKLFDQNLHPNVNAVQWQFRGNLLFGKFEIRVRPVVGCYPNLEGLHAMNFSQDYHRIKTALVAEEYCPGTPYTKGAWVCIRFHKQEAA